MSTHFVPVQVGDGVPAVAEGAAERGGVDNGVSEGAEERGGRKGEWGFWQGGEQFQGMCLCVAIS